MTPLWTKKYAGIDFKDRGRSRGEGVDCWGLVRLIYLEEFGVELPDLSSCYESIKDLDAISDQVAAGERDWTEVGWATAHEGDVVLLRGCGGLPEQALKLMRRARSSLSWRNSSRRPLTSTISTSQHSCVVAERRRPGRSSTTRIV